MEGLKQQPIWQPSSDTIANSNMTQFTDALAKKAQQTFDDYQCLHQWSVDHPADFWAFVADYCNIHFTTAPTEILSNAEPIENTKWFSGATLNFAAHLLRHSKNQPALIFHNENGERKTVSFNLLRSLVAQTASALKQAGVTQGDRVAGFMPNRPETVIAMLATASLGAIWSSCSSDFGYHGVFDRLRQVEPKVLFTADGHFYNGKAHDSLAIAHELLDHLPCIQTCVLVPNVNPQIKAAPNMVLWQDFLDLDATELEFTPVDFAAPLYIMFSSGTTGKPKCIVHSVGGTLIQHLKELQLHTNLKPEDTLFYFTTCGWMMWNWLVSALALGTTVVLYDGSPLYPNTKHLFDLIDQEQISVFGTSAKFITAVEKSQLQPATTHRLNSLHTILSTGSPLVPRNYEFVYQHIKSDVRLSSISGGTDIISCFALGNPNLPVYRSELQCLGLGMKVEVFDARGHSIRQQKGELVCTAPFPSMPVGFWHDPSKQRFHRAYFNKYANVWAHGDYAEITAHGGLIIYGRSDTVLNPGGVRIGTAEIYREVEHIPEVLESIAIGQPVDDDVRVVLFVKLRPNVPLDRSLKQKIRESIKLNVSPHHVPKKIIAVADIPRTISGKIVELAVRNVVMGQAVENIDALANPESLAYYKNLSELQD